MYVRSPSSYIRRYAYVFCRKIRSLTFRIVTPGITAQEYAQRRSRLANRLPKNAIAIVAAADIKYRAAGVFYEYRQDSNFFYLTGMPHTKPGTRY
jgi:hypothetical protein